MRSDESGAVEQATPDDRGEFVGSWSRRTVLGGSLVVALGALAACSDSPAPAPSTSSEADPDVAVALAALTGELTLLGTYAAAVRQTPSLASALEPLRAEHQAHADAIRAAVAVADPARVPEIAIPAAPAGALAVLRKAEQDAATARTADCVSAADTELARTLALIAASEAGHVAVLNGVTDSRSGS